MWGVGRGWGWGGGMGGGGVGCRKISENFPGDFREISEKFPGVRKREIEIVRPQNKIFTNRLQEMNPEIMPDPPVEYLRKCKFNHFHGFFPTGFIYQYTLPV